MANKIKFFIAQSWLLVVSAVLFGMLLAITDAAWRPRIEKNQQDKFNRIASSLLAGAAEFQVPKDLKKAAIDMGKGKTAKADITKVIDAEGKHIGWAFLCQGSGFADKIKLVAAADVSFTKIAGFGVLSSNETPGFGDKITVKDGFYQSQFKGMPAEQLNLKKAGDDKKIDNEIIAITGATVSSQAVVDIFNNCLPKVKEILKQKGYLK